MGLEGKPRLLLADDHQEVLRELTEILGREFNVVGTASNGITLVQKAEELRPDVVVADLKMPELNGIEAARQLLESKLCRAVVLLTIYADAQLVAMARAAGVLGYVIKDHASTDLIPAIRTALEGREFVSRNPGTSCAPGA